jgi:integrase
MPTLTKRHIDAAKPAAKDVYLWDSDVSGFGLKVTPAGRKVFIIQYRPQGVRRTRRVTIGRHGSPWTVDMARKEALRLLSEVAQGRDPQDDRQAQKGALTLREAVHRWLVEHVEAKRKTRTGDGYRAALNLHVLPELGGRLLRDITRPEIAKLHHGLRAKPYMANQVVRVLSSLFTWAERHGLRPDGSNPCRHIEKYREQGRERFLSPREIERLGRALRVAERSGALTIWSCAAIRLLLLTGARLNEILTLRWRDVDMGASVLRLPDSKTGAKTIHLNPPALAVLTSVPTVEGNPYVIVGAKEGRHLVNLEKPWRRLRKAALLEDVRLHDLRHSFASVAVAAGQSLPLIGKLLGQTQPATTARYAHLADDPLQAASAAVGGRIDAALQGKSATVLALRKSRRS